MRAVSRLYCFATFNSNRAKSSEARVLAVPLLNVRSTATCRARHVDSTMTEVSWFCNGRALKSYPSIHLLTCAIDISKKPSVRHQTQRRPSSIRFKTESPSLERNVPPDFAYHPLMRPALSIHRAPSLLLEVGPCETSVATRGVCTENFQI